MARSGSANVVVFDLAGRRVRTLFDGALEAGTHEWRWDGRDGAGRRVPGGVYLCRIDSGGASAAARVVLLP
jgi:flagellar hook assembly protein FlgD